MRGYCCIGLDNPKTPANVGSIMRAAGCYGVSTVFYSGQRYKKAKQFVTDPQKVYRHIPLISTDDLHGCIPYDCVPIAVDLLEGATSLIDYKHPERAFYIFGAEDATLGKKITSWCKDIIYVPTNGCMNLAASVNVILYDRLFKQTRKDYYHAANTKTIV
jgi:tRNA(Leu) C34 or U34 (ribose-2'-O)-methylase TrmL